VSFQEQNIKTLSHEQVALDRRLF